METAIFTGDETQLNTPPPMAQDEDYLGEWIDKIPERKDPDDSTDESDEDTLGEVESSNVKSCLAGKHCGWSRYNHDQRMLYKMRGRADRIKCYALASLEIDRKDFEEDKEVRSLELFTKDKKMSALLYMKRAKFSEEELLMFFNCLREKEFLKPINFKSKK